MRSWTLVVAVALVGLILAVLFSARVSRQMSDLEVYWTGAVRARAAQPLYRAEDRHYQFKYLPASAVLTIPLGLVSLGTAKAVWFAISLALLAALVALSLQILPDRRKPAWLLVVVTLVAMLKFYAHEIILGQMNLLLGVCSLLAIRALAQRHETAAGLWVTLAIVVKPYAVILVPWLAARRQLASLGAVACGIVAMLALPAVLYGPAGNVDLHLAWWHTVTNTTAPNLTNQDNVSVAAMYTKWLGLGPTATLLTGLTIVCLLAAAALTFARRSHVTQPETVEGALLLIFIPLISPQGWDYVFLLSTPAIMLLTNYADHLSKSLRAFATAAVAIIGLSLFDVMGRTAYATFMALSIITPCYFVVVAALVSLRLRRVA